MMAIFCVAFVEPQQTENCLTVICILTWSALQRSRSRVLKGAESDAVPLIQGVGENDPKKGRTEI